MIEKKETPTTKRRRTSEANTDEKSLTALKPNQKFK